MRMMANFNFSVAPGSDLIRSGKLNTSFERLMEDLKPEAAYFFTNRDGDRSGLVFFDLPSRATFSTSSKASPSVLGHASR